MVICYSYSLQSLGIPLDPHLWLSLLPYSEGILTTEEDLSNSPNLKSRLKTYLVGGVGGVVVVVGGRGWDRRLKAVKLTNYSDDELARVHEKSWAK